MVVQNQCLFTGIKQLNRNFLVSVEWQDSSKSFVMVILGLAFGSINN